MILLARRLTLVDSTFPRLDRRVRREPVAAARFDIGESLTHSLVDCSSRCTHSENRRSVFPESRLPSLEKKPRQEKEL